MHAYIHHISLRPETALPQNADALAEYHAAVQDLATHNYFELVATNPATKGPYHMALEMVDNRLLMHVSQPEQAHHTPVEHTIRLAITPFRRIMKDYLMLCESFHRAKLPHGPNYHYEGQMETLDMARRSLHDEGSELLRDLLKSEAKTDQPTARKLFTLLYALHLRTV